MKTYTGGCQCGAVQYEATTEIQEVLSCNCSRCSRLGALLAFVPAAAFKLLSGKDDLTKYLFNKHAIEHFFCKTCGIQSFSRGTGQDGQEMVALNVRCIPEVDIDILPVNRVDGKNI
jgi:hypothetical protein